MLDAYIIDQLRREDERSRSAYLPLYIEPPQPPGPDAYRDQDNAYSYERGVCEVDSESASGVVIIDYYSDSDDDD